MSTSLSRYELADRIRVAVDCIIFGFDGNELNVLLIRRDFEPEKGAWSLAGGMIAENESVDDAAYRVLKDLTGISDIYMEQLHCFGEVQRDTAARVISVAYFSVINIAEYSREITATHEAQWFPLNNIPDLVFDHGSMVEKARERLRQKVANHPVGFELLPVKFTLPQLRKLYQSIYQTSFDKRNFTKKILSLGILKKLNEKERQSSKKGAFYYMFDHAKYRKLEQEGINFL